MAAIHDLLAQIQDEALRERIEKEIDKLSKTKKFGLVFEEHMPECTPLYDVPVKRGATVAKRDGAINDIYVVQSMKGENAICMKKSSDSIEEISVSDLVSVAEFGDPIYPYLKPLDVLCNAPDNDLWHSVIEADNYHALQLLEYLYAGKIDCIYIDKNENNERNSKPPLAAWAVSEIYKSTQDADFVKEIYPKLLHYHQWWYKYRDHDRNGYCEFGAVDGTLEAAAWESGMFFYGK